MKKIVCAVLSVALFWSFSAFAATYKSDFGFTVDLPSGWTITSKKGVKEKPEIVDAVFESADKNKTLLDMPESLYRQLKEKIAGGEVEYYYKTDSPNFSISVFQQNGTVPATPAEVEQLCRNLPADLMKVSKNPAVKVYECRTVALGSVPALYIVADAYERGEKYVQYMVQRGPDEMLLFTATSSGRKGFDTMKSEFDAIMKSLAIT